MKALHLHPIADLLRPFADPGEGEAQVPEWIHVIPFGTWTRHGQSIVIGVVQGQQAVDNFSRMMRDLVIDYEHQSLNAEENGQPAPAAGWIDREEMRADGVWAHVRQWTERATGFIRAREYRYVSPVLSFWASDKHTGENVGAHLHSVALTNTPFFDELTPIANSDSGGSDMLRALLAVLGLPATATEAEATTAVNNLKARADVGDLAIKELGLDLKAADVKEKATNAFKHSGYVSFEDHAKALQAASDKETSLTDDQLVDKLRREGKLTPALESWFRGTLKRDRPGALEFAAKMHVVVPVAPATIVAPAKPYTLDEIEILVAKQLGLDAKTFKGASR